MRVRGNWSRIIALSSAILLVILGINLASAPGNHALAVQATSIKPLLVGKVTAGGSRIVTTKLKGAKSRLTDTVITVLPREYDLPENAHTKFPYLIMFSGMPGSAGSWVKYLDIVPSPPSTFKTGSIHRPSGVKLRAFTADLPTRLRALYAQ